MTDLLAALIAVANRTARPLAEVVRHHFLEGVLRRVRSDGFALRGSLLTRVWAGDVPRPAADADFVGLFPHDVKATAERFFAPLASRSDDGVVFDQERCHARGIWLDTAFPGVRLTVIGTLLGDEHATTIDVGFGDPLVPPGGWLEYPTTDGGETPVFAVRRSTLAAWKLHGLTEWGDRNWRAKDVLDLWLLLRFAPLLADELADAIRAAFESRGNAVSEARRVLEHSTRWHDPRSQRRWLALFPGGPPHSVPKSVTDVIAEIRRSLAEPFARLSI